MLDTKVLEAMKLETGVRNGQKQIKEKLKEKLLRNFAAKIFANFEYGISRAFREKGRKSSKSLNFLYAKISVLHDWWYS